LTVTLSLRITESSGERLQDGDVILINPINRKTKQKFPLVFGICPDDPLIFEKLCALRVPLPPVPTDLNPCHFSTQNLLKNLVKPGDVFTIGSALAGWTGLA
jgi:hypothetical protein